MKLAWLEPDTPFPALDRALQEPDGLLAVGADLTTARLADAYAHGIFPWFSEGEPILWWSPDPRMVLQCAHFAPGRALRKRLRQIARQSEIASCALGTDHPSAGTVEVRVDTAFDQVMAACAAPRDGQPGTWITLPMQRAYRQWHREGATHSVETWIDGRLAGGLYGVSLGTMFFGESMFTRVSDASKIALAYLVTFLARHDVQWIDCQQQTHHLASLGAAPVARADFAAHVAQARHRPRPPWQSGRLTHEGVIVPLGPDAQVAVI